MLINTNDSLPEIAKLEEQLRFVHQNVVRLDIGMNNVRLLHNFEGQQHLLSVRSDCFDVEANVLAILFQHL